MPTGSHAKSKFTAMNLASFADPVTIHSQKTATHAALAVTAQKSG
jgi:hypothetical protein